MWGVLGIAILLCAMPPIGQAQNSPDDYLTPHNEARAAVGVGPLQWDATLAEYAQDYANQRIGDCALRHSRPGENLAKGFGANFNAAKAVKLWVEEQENYDHATNSCARGKVCGHYTQVVWRATVSVGCAHAVCNNGYIFIICSYNPPGNVVGQSPY